MRRYPTQFSSHFDLALGICTPLHYPSNDPIYYSTTIVYKMYNDERKS